MKLQPQVSYKTGSLMRVSAISKEFKTLSSLNIAAAEGLQRRTKRGTSVAPSQHALPMPSLYTTIQCACVADATEDFRIALELR